MNEHQQLKKLFSIFAILGTLAFTNGVHSQPISENFVQKNYEGPLDILLIVDINHSGSLNYSTFISNLNSFLSPLNGTQWRLAMTTSDMSSHDGAMQGHLFKFAQTGRTFLSKEDLNYSSTLERTLNNHLNHNCPSDGCTAESYQPLKALEAILERTAKHGSSFLRRQAPLITLILSPTDELVNGPFYATKPRKVHKVFTSLYGGVDIISFGFITPEYYSDCQFDLGPIARYSSHIDEFTKVTTGLSHSLCEHPNSFSEAFDAMAKHAKKRLTTVQLKQKPIPASIQIHFSPVHTTQWQLIGKKTLLFKNPPPEGTSIEIKYIPSLDVIDPL